MIDLLTYITEMPTEEDSHDRANKFPFLVSDILSQSNSPLLDIFFEEEEEEEEVVVKTEEKEEPEEEETTEEATEEPEA